MYKAAEKCDFQPGEIVASETDSEMTGSRTSRQGLF